KHDRPAQPCLKGIQHNIFKKFPVIMYRNTPFCIMIGPHQVAGLAPAATFYRHIFFSINFLPPSGIFKMDKFNYNLMIPEGLTPLFYLPNYLILEESLWIVNYK